MKRLLATVSLAAVLAAVTATGARAQDPSAAPAADELRVFLDCPSRCDTDYLRTEISFVQYVRDRQDADVHLLITTQGTGAGGTEFTLRFVGQKGFAGVEEELRYASGPRDSQDQVRQGMARVLKGGLVRYAVRTPLAQRLELSFAPVAGQKRAAAPGAGRRDPWNAWVFRTGVGGSLNGEAAYRSHNLNANASATRTTSRWKTGFYANTRSSRSDTRVGDGWVTNQQRDHSLSLLHVKSISNHWSTGLRANANHSTYSNRDLALRLAPALEFNVFPYSESTRRELTLQYTVGANRVRYLQETIYDRLDESLLDEELAVSLNTRQRWGSARTSLQGSHYLQELGKYRLEANGGIDVRVFRGVSVNLNGAAESIHDQLYLVKGTLTPEQILLRQRQVATAYRYNGSLGLSYSFGSIFNAVVNPRLN